MKSKVFSGPEAVRGHFVRPAASSTQTLSHPLLILSVVKERGQKRRSGEVKRMAFDAEDDPDATDGEESGEVLSA